MDDGMFSDTFSSSLTDTSIDINVDTGPDLNDYMFNPIYSWHPLSIYNSDND